VLRERGDQQQRAGAADQGAEQAVDAFSSTMPLLATPG
jgi:hypothetical protein